MVEKNKGITGIISAIRGPIYCFVTVYRGENNKEGSGSQTSQERVGRKKPGGKNDGRKKAWWKGSLVCFEKHGKKPGVSFVCVCTSQD